MLHNITISRTSAQLVEAYNANANSWTVPAPMGVKVGDDVLMTSRDGVGFQCFVAGRIVEGDEMIIRIRG